MLTRTDLEDLLVLVTNTRYKIDHTSIDRNKYTTEEYTSLTEERQLTLKKYDRLLIHIDKELDKYLNA